MKPTLQVGIFVQLKKKEDDLKKELMALSLPWSDDMKVVNLFYYVYFKLLIFNFFFHYQQLLLGKTLQIETINVRQLVLKNKIFLIFLFQTGKRTLLRGNSSYLIDAAKFTLI